MIESLSWKLANNLKAQNPEHPRSVAVLKHAISFLLNTSFIIVITLLIAIVTGKFIEALEVLTSYAILRQFSGGIHLKSGTMCVIVSVVGATIVSFSSYGITSIFAVNLISILLALIYAPSRLESRIKKQNYIFFEVDLSSNHFKQFHFPLSSDSYCFPNPNPDFN